jgi:Family of unknown function (DUF5990)
VLVRVEGRELPGRRFGEYADVHVALQVGNDPYGPVPGDAATARWETEVRVFDGDFRGTAVHGKRGDRFLYLTWGTPAGDDWGMFRRAKLMLDRVDPALVRKAAADGRALVATVSLTDSGGCPRCARVDSPAVEWSVQRSGGRSL